MPYSKSFTQRYMLKWRPVQTTASAKPKPDKKRYSEKQKVEYVPNKRTR